MSRTRRSWLHTGLNIASLIVPVLVGLGVASAAPGDGIVQAKAIRLACREDASLTV